MRKKRKIINFAVRREEIRARRKAAAFTLLCAAAALVFADVAIVLPYQSAWILRDEYHALEREVEALKAETADYEQIRQVYRQYNGEVLSWEERNEIRRQLLFELIESAMTAKGDLYSVTISGNTMSARVVGTTLQTLSEAEAKLLADDMVDYVRVVIAQKPEETPPEKLSSYAKGTVDADLYIYLKTGGVIE